MKKKALLMAPMGSVHRRFNKANIEALKECGYEVHLLANFSVGEGPELHNADYVKECEKNGIHTHSLPFSRGSLFKNINLISGINSLLETNKFQIVHTHTETGGILLRLCKNPQHSAAFCFTPHGMSFYKGSSLISQMVYRPIEKWICNGMDANLAMNQEEMDSLLKWNRRTARFVHGIGLDISRMKVSSEACRNAIKKEFNIPDHALMLLSIGELNTNKNHAAVIKALALIDKTVRPHYVICGVGEEEEYLRKLIIDCKLEDFVVLAGYRADIPQIVASADIFVFPSFHEGLPVSVLEAMAGGLPVITSEIRGNVDLIKEDYNGYLFSPDDSDEIACKLNRLLTDETKRREMGKLNSQLAEKYSFEVVKQELKEIYSGLEASRNKHFVSK